jgi:Zn-dependent protease
MSKASVNRSSIVAIILVGLKFLKSAKVLLALGSLLVYSVLLSWQTAIVFLAGLCVHEYGHVWAMRKCGIPTKGFYLIPFVGGVCSPERSFRERFEEAYVASMGPIFGLAAALPCLGLAYILTGNLSRAVDAMNFVVIVNMFNLLPITPMDGGRIIRAVVSSFSRWAGIILVFSGVILTVFLTWYLRAPLMIWIAILGAVEGIDEIRSGHIIDPLSKWKALGWLGIYVAIFLAGSLLLSLGAYIKGDHGFVDMLRNF